MRLCFLGAFAVLLLGEATRAEVGWYTGSPLEAGVVTACTALILAPFAAMLRRRKPPAR